MFSGFVSPQKTTARYLPGSPRQRYKEAMGRKKDDEKEKEGGKEKVDKEET